jgi:Plant transposon protein
MARKLLCWRRWQNTIFFWHASFGYCGTLNDVSILSLSPLLDRMVNGELHVIEKDSGVVPFRIGEEKFQLLFILVDGINPLYSRLVRWIKEPISEKQKKYTAWQEACRKDIERAVGVLKCTWQCLGRPFLL